MDELQTVWVLQTSNDEGDSYVYLYRTRGGAIAAALDEAADMAEQLGHDPGELTEATVVIKTDAVIVTLAEELSEHFDIEVYERKLMP